MPESLPRDRMKGHVDPKLIEPSLAYAREHGFDLWDLAEWVLAGRPGLAIADETAHETAHDKPEQGL